MTTINPPDNPKRANSYQNAAGTLRWVDDCYWHVSYNEGHDVTLEEHSEFFVFASEYNNYKVPAIIERQHSYSATVDVYQFSQEFMPLYVNAIAIVCYTSTSTSICEHLRDTYFTDLPVAIFSRMDEAVKWIKANHTGGPRIPSGK